MRQRPGPFPDTEPRCARLSPFAPVLPLLLLFLSAAVLFGSSSSFACEESGGFQICLSYYTENYLRLPQVDRTLFRAETESFFTKHADGVMRQRNELRLDLHYSPDPEKYTFGIPLEFNLRVRPFYDTAYDMTGWGQGQYRKYLVPDWNSNLNGSMDDQYDPLLREYYVDILPKNLFVRVGRQIISWGKSDGVYMLDILNPFNLANPTNFDEQYNKIPIWAINANYQVTSTGTIQFVYEPKYLPYYYPGLPLKGGLPYQGQYQDFTPNVVGFFNAEENGLLKLHEIIRLGFDGKVEDVSRELFRKRVANAGRPDYIAINFFLFNTIRNGRDVLVADELVFQGLTSDHSVRFDKLALFAFNFSYVGLWRGASPDQRYPALWARHYVIEQVANRYGWNTSKISADDIERFVRSDPRYKAKTARKLATNLNYLYRVGRLRNFADSIVDRWWVDALFLALDRLIEDRKLDRVVTAETQFASLLDQSEFTTLSGKQSLEKRLAAKHLVDLYIACGARERFSEDLVKKRTLLTIPDIDWLISNNPLPKGAVHPSNPRILKSIPWACAMLARYAGFEVITADELENFDPENFVREHTKSALERLKQENISPTMSVEKLMKLTREK